jgi:hypothetical protein
MNEDKTTYVVYTLCDPQTKMIRYVGLTKQTLKQRFSKHICGNVINWKRNHKKTQWIQDLKAIGLLPIIEELSTFDNYEDALLEETYFTYQALAWGFDLFNMQYGKHPTLETHLKARKEREKTPIDKRTREASKAAIIKPTVQFTRTGIFIKVWDYIAEAGRELNIERGSISRCCMNKAFLAGGFGWQYLDKTGIITPPIKQFKNESHLHWRKRQIEKLRHIDNGRRPGRPRKTSIHPWE